MLRKGLAPSLKGIMTAIKKISAYLKPQCGWSRGVRAIFDKHSLQYEDIDIINNPDNYAEMVAKSNQPLSPCVELTLDNGEVIMLADVSGEEVEQYMLETNLITPNSKEASAPTNSACTDAEHEKMRQDAAKDDKSIRFF